MPTDSAEQQYQNKCHFRPALVCLAQQGLQTPLLLPEYLLLALLTTAANSGCCILTMTCFCQILFEFQLPPPAPLYLPLLLGKFN